VGGGSDVPAAKQALAAVSADARSKLPASRALVAAEIAVAENDGAAAIHELDSIGVPASGDLAQNYWLLRGQGAFLTGHPVEGTRAFIERERFLPDSRRLGCQPQRAVQQDPRRRERRQLLKIPRTSIPLSPAGCSWDRWRWNCSAIRCTPRLPWRIGGACFRSIRRTTAY